LARWLEGDYLKLRASLRAAEVVHADETGWRTDGKNGYLWTLTDPRHTLYHVDRSRGGEVIKGLLGGAFGTDGEGGTRGGTLVSDFYGVYDQFPGPRQKCLTHLLRELRETIARRPELEDHTFFVGCRRLVGRMLALGRQRDRIKPEAYRRRVALAESCLAAMASNPWGDPDADRLAARLGRHRESLTTFLHLPGVEPTNNAAERAIRFVVIDRLVTQGTRGETGQRFCERMWTVVATCAQRGWSVFEYLQEAVRAHFGGGPAPSLLGGKG
jgi:hypothetical protein